MKTYVISSQHAQLRTRDAIRRVLLHTWTTHYKLATLHRYALSQCFGTDCYMGKQHPADKNATLTMYPMFNKTSFFVQMEQLMKHPNSHKRSEKKRQCSVLSLMLLYLNTPKSQTPTRACMKLNYSVKYPVSYICQYYLITKSTHWRNNYNKLYVAIYQLQFS